METRYEARIVENEETGSWYILLNEEGEAIEGTDAESVRAEALATLEERGYLPEPRLRIAKITVEYV